MAVYKVEICGVNTASLPVLNEAEKTELFRRVQKGDSRPENFTSREICVWY